MNAWILACTMCFGAEETAMVDGTKSNRHGLRSLVHAVTRSPAFLNK